MKQYKQLPIPEDSAWGRKSWRNYAPIWFKEFITGCNNLIKWFPTIWKQRDWDQSYIYEIIKQKLIFQREELVNANRHVDIWQVNRDITICLNLIELIQEDYYEIEYLDEKYIKQSFNFVPTEEKFDGEDTFEMKNEVHYKDFVPYFVKYINQYKKLRRYGFRGMKLKKEDDKRIALYLGMVNDERARTLLFKILNERINHWWD